jgi:hypothetical protein
VSFARVTTVTGYELIDSNPEFGFGKKQVVAMKVYKKDNKKTVDIIPTAHTGYHDDMDLTVDALRAVRLSRACIADDVDADALLTISRRGG